MEVGVEVEMEMETVRAAILPVVQTGLVMVVAIRRVAVVTPMQTLVINTDFIV